MKLTSLLFLLFLLTAPLGAQTIEEEPDDPTPASTEADPSVGVRAPDERRKPYTLAGNGGGWNAGGSLR